MAEKAPDAVDVTDILFKIQNKIKIFTSNVIPKDNCQLVAAASVYGLVFVGCPTPELKVLQLTSLTESKKIDEPIPIRTIPLPSEPLQISLNCDHSLLAVDLIINGTSFIVLYYVPSFLSQNVKMVHNIRLSPEEGVRSKQLAWNPTIPDALAICLTNGALSMYNFKEKGFEFHSMDKSQNIGCVCWSPRGKQIVAGHGNGKLVQYKPDLKPARTIQCPVSPQNGPFEIIAIQWLSTYQFAAVFLLQGDDVGPTLHIINAPKSGVIGFINYDDICYSNYGPRKAQIYIIHLQQWNMLLFASSNSMEVGVLATTETGDTPMWKQWCMLDEARAELPLTEDKQETYPVGFSIETGCTHQTLIGENSMSVLAMIHLISTHGFLVSFNILNTSNSLPGVCSPPRQVADLSGLNQFITAIYPSPEQVPSQPMQVAQPQLIQKPIFGQDIYFNPSGGTSTPAPTQKHKNMFNSITGSESSKVASNLFGNVGGNALPQNRALSFANLEPDKPLFGTTTTVSLPFGGTPSAQSISFGTSGLIQPKPTIGPMEKTMFRGSDVNASQPLQFGSPIVTSSTVFSPKTTIPSPIFANKAVPLITVPTTFSSPKIASAPDSKASSTIIPFDDDNNDIIRKMIDEEIQAFESELKELLTRSKNIKIQVGTKEESANMLKELNELNELLTIQATESTDSLTAEIQTLNLSLNEAFSMAAEAASKHSMFMNPDYMKIQENTSLNQTNRRKLMKLQNLLAINERQMQMVHKQIDALWSEYEGQRKQNAKDRMHVPNLESVYQTIKKQRDILNKQRERLNCIKSKIGMKGTIISPHEKHQSKINTTLDSITDSLLSITLYDQVKAETSRLSDDKWQALKEVLRNRKVTIIKPQRPNRKGINSEVVREKREAARNILTMAKNQQEVKRTSSHLSAKNVEKSQGFTLASANTSTNIKPTALTDKPTMVNTKPSYVVTSSFPEIKAALSKSSSSAKVSPFSTAPAFNFDKTQVINKALEKELSKPQISFGSGSKTDEKSSLFSFNSSNFTVSTSSEIEKKSPVPIFSAGSSQSTTSTPILSFGSNKNNSEISKTKPALIFTAPAVAAPKSAEKIIGFGGNKENLETSDNIKQSSVVQPKVIFGCNNLITKQISPAALSSVSASDQSTTDFKVTSTSNSIFDVAKTISTPTSLIFGQISNTQQHSSVVAPAAAAATATVTAAAATAAAATAAAAAATTTTTVTATSLPSVAATTAPNIFGQNSGNITFGGVNFTSRGPEDKKETTQSISIISLVTSSTTSPTATITTTVAATTTTITTSTTASSFQFGSFLSGLPATHVTSVTSTTEPDTSIKDTSKFTFSLPSTTTKTDTAPISQSNTTMSNTPAADSADSLFKGLTVCQPIALETKASTTSPAKADNIFSLKAFNTPTTSNIASSIFGGTNTSPAFGGTTLTSEPAKPLFGNISTTAATSPPSGIFTSIPKPDQSVFGANTTPTVPLFGSSNASAASVGNLFGSDTAANTASPFGGVGSGSVFGGATVVTAPQQTSIFGGTASTGNTTTIFGTPKTESSSIFGSSNIFGQATTPQTTPFGTINTASSQSGNIFGQGAGSNASSGGSLFGSSNMFSNTSNQQTGGSIFGSGTSGGFGTTFGQATTQTSAFGSTSAFGQQSTGFGSPNSSFAQGGPSVAQTGFGSPTFVKPPAFGSPPTFGGPATFGAAASFGGGATFGSPIKSGFGTFATSNTNTFTAPTQQNSLFASLGSSDTGMTFGNLAQSTDSTQKPQFGGSAFSSWR